MSINEISTKTLNDFTLVISPGTRLDNNNAHEMIEMINQAQSDGYKFIFIDMVNLEFISSAGVGVILGTIDNSRGQGGDIVIYNASDTIIHVFEVLDLLSYLTIKDSEEKAVEYIS